MSFWNELNRRNVLKVGIAYAVAAWLLVQVAATLAPQLQLPEWAPRLVTFLLMLGFPIALLVSWFLEHTPEGLKLERSPVGTRRIVAAAIVLAALAVGWFLREHRQLAERGSPAATDSAPATATPPAAQTATNSGARTIAVLPFVNMSGDPEQEFFADGLSEEILNSLARIDGMQVVGRTSSFQFKGRNEDLRTVGSRLGVASVLEGSVRRDGERVRVTAQLVRASDGFHLWSETYDRTLEDVFAVQLDIAEKVAAALEVVLDDAQRERMRSAGVRSVEAFVAFQRGKRLYEEAHRPARGALLIETLRKANVEFATATRLEPGFEQAYYLASDLYTHVIGEGDASEAERAAVMRDLDLAERHAENPVQRATIEVSRQLLSDDWRGIGDRIRRASTPGPCHESNWLMVVAPFGHAEERLASGRARLACDPLSFLSYVSVIDAALWARSPDTALDLISRGRRALGREAEFMPSEVLALLAAGRFDDARARAKLLPADNWFSVIALANVAAATGGKAVLPDAASGARFAGPFPAPHMAAMAAAASGDRARANTLAVQLDRRPGGALLLAGYVGLCHCGAPFDLDATPNFKARLAEAEFPWPPPEIIPRASPSARTP